MYNENQVLPAYTSSSVETCRYNFLYWRISQLQAWYVCLECQSDQTYPWDQHFCPIAQWISKQTHHNQHWNKHGRELHTIILTLY